MEAILKVLKYKLLFSTGRTWGFTFGFIYGIYINGLNIIHNSLVEFIQISVSSIFFGILGAIGGDIWDFIKKKFSKWRSKRKK